jgi:glucose-6-phosphate isomerase
MLHLDLQGQRLTEATLFVFAPLNPKVGVARTMRAVKMGEIFIV